MKTIGNIVLLAALLFSTGLSRAAVSSARRIAEGASTPEFSTVDIAGKPFAYKRSSAKVLMLAFLSSEQKRSKEAVEDIYKTLSAIPADKRPILQIAFVMQNVDNEASIASLQKDAPCPLQVIADDKYKIWGTFGVIATPTVLISNRQGKVLCVKPGHAYDFAPVIKSRLFQALGLPHDVSPEKASSVRTVANSTVSAKAKRHLQMAKLLLRKGRIDSALEQARMAREIDPDSPGVAIELGELLCQAGQSQKAIELVSDQSTRSKLDKARVNLVLGWAHRQLNLLDKAERFLQEGIKQNPKSPRLHYELGRIYQARNESEKAMQAYAQALRLVYPEN